MHVFGRNTDFVKVAFLPMKFPAILHNRFSLKRYVAPGLVSPSYTGGVPSKSGLNPH